MGLALAEGTLNEPLTHVVPEHDDHITNHTEFAIKLTDGTILPGRSKSDLEAHLDLDRVAVQGLSDERYADAEVIVRSVLTMRSAWDKFFYADLDDSKED